MKNYSVTAADNAGNKYHLQLASDTSFSPKTCDTNKEQEAVEFFNNCVIAGVNVEKCEITVELNVFEDGEYVETLKSKTIND